MTMLARCSAGFLALALAAATAACTSSAGKSGNGTSATGSSGGSVATSGSGSTSAPPGGSSGSSASTPAAGTGTPADPSTKKSITSAYAAFFNSKSAVTQSEAALQHGSAFHATLVQQAKGQYSNNSSAKVGAVNVSGKRAYVTFSILSNGKPLLNNFKGYAVLESGKWKVAAITFCTLLQLQGGAPAVCNDPTMTSLPQ
jgi:hypothetical protein